MNAKILEHPTLAQNKQCTGLAAALETTEEMLMMARAGKWGSVRDLENKRREYLDECMSKPVNRKDVQLFSDALSTLLTLNASLMACVYETRQALVKQQHNSQKTAALAGRYLER